MKPPSPWQPITDKLELALLGKALEEINEAGAILSRCIIQGPTGCEPDTDKSNLLQLREEISDVIATCQLVIEYYNLSQPMISLRVQEKIQHLRQWHDLLD